MPNYYIQAKRGTFNPFSFDEYVKPLNMYKEYYEKNEEAITDMQEQANLWKNIMESEKDSKLADKYNTYVNNLNNATQQLKNGMSYNLRNQIQQLRGQSAMVKQIENAYNLRAKDIDAYNELMIKDPSRIGADDPTTRSLNDYLNGPVKNNYGVSGDRLYALGNARAKAMSAQKDVYGNVISTLGNQYFMLKHTKGYSDKEITEMLKNQSPELFNEIDRIIQQEGTQLNNYDDLNTAETYILNGMLSGFTYNEDRKYMKNENYMNPWEIAKTEEQIRGLMLDNDKKEVELGKLLGLGDTKDYWKSLTSDKVGLFQTTYGKEFKDNGLEDVMLRAFNDNSSKTNINYHFDNNGNLTSSDIEKVKKLDPKTYSKVKEVVALRESKKLQQSNNDVNAALSSPIVNPIDARITILTEEIGKTVNGGYSEGLDILKEYEKGVEQLNKVNQLKQFAEQFNGKTNKEKIENAYKFYRESGQVKNIGGLAFIDNEDYNKVVGTLDKLIKNDSVITLKDATDDKIYDHDETVKLLKKGFSIHPSMNGFALTIDGKRYFVNTSELNFIQKYNDDIFAENAIIRNPIELINGKKIFDKKQNEQTLINDGDGLYSLNKNIMYYLYKDNNNTYIHLINYNNGRIEKEKDIKLFDVDSWYKDVLSTTKDMGETMRLMSSSKE